MKAFILAGALALYTFPALGQNIKSMQLASELGTVLAAEKACGFTYDQAAITGWIDANTDPSDMSFAGTLSTMAAGAEFELTDMSQSLLTAHCRAVSRTAKHYGFMQ